MNTLDDTTLLKTCTKCGRALPATSEHFYFRFGFPIARCKACICAERSIYRKTQPGKVNACNKRWRDANLDKAHGHSKKWAAAHPEKVLERTNRWAAAHPEWVAEKNHRRRAVDGVFTAEDVGRQYEIQSGKCFYCHKKLDKYHIEHVTPVILGGSNWPYNIVLSCPGCNLSKGAKHPMDFCGRLL